MLKEKEAASRIALAATPPFGLILLPAERADGNVCAVSPQDPKGL